MFKKLGSFLQYAWRWADGTLPQKSVAALAAYIPVGGLYRLGGWAKRRLQYKRDRNPMENFEQDLDAVVARGGLCDCEEIAMILCSVIRTWAGYSSEVLALVHKFSPSKNHAVCYFRGPSAHGILDSGYLRLYPLDVKISDIVRESFPETRRWLFVDFQGYPKGEHHDL